MTSSSRINLNGIDASVILDFHPRLGAKVDLNYVRAASVFGTAHHADVLSYLMGPVFYPSSNYQLTTYVQALVGGGRVTGVVPNGAGGFTAGYANRVSWAFGGGIEFRLSPSLAIRTEIDYLHTAYFGSVGFRGQNNLRTVGGIVYHWGGNSQEKRENRRF